MGTLWIVWAILTVGGFAVIEAVALFNSTGRDTLSEHLWAWLGLRVWPLPPHITPRWTLRVARMAFITGMMWLTLHIVTGGWV